MTLFTTWAEELAKAKNAVASRSWDAYFQSSVENHQQMRTTFTTLGNVTKFIEWLEMKAYEESSGLSPGTIPFVVGGN
jgi:hypothetical protein